MTTEADLDYKYKQNDEIVITGINEKNIEKIPEGKKKITLSSLAAKSGIAGLLAGLASNRLFIFFGNMGEDSIISMLEHWATKFQYGAGGVPQSAVLENLFRLTEKGLSVAWATVMANPTAAAALVGAFVAAGGFIIGIGKKIKASHKKVAGKIYEADNKKKTHI